jgi:hypothetical protein
MNTPRNQGELERNKKHFNEYTLQKKKFSIAREIYVIVKPLKNWYEGITMDLLNEKIIENFKKKGYHKKKISKISIYSAIKDLNLYRKDIYIVSSKGLNAETNKYEFRYFCPFEPNDINHAKELLERIIFRSEIKNGNLTNFQEEIVHQEQIDVIKQTEQEAI